MASPNYYQLLGVAPNATQEEIDVAFQREADKYNPSLNPGHESRFQQILDAYTVLKNPNDREEYNSRHGFDTNPNPLRIVLKRKSKEAPEPEEEKTLTQLMDFDWDELDEPSEEEKKRLSKDFRQELAFKIFIILAFIGLISLIWVFL